MFQFPGLPPSPLCVRGEGDAPRRRAGFSHSETRGSKGVCPSPRIIAACRVLRRLPVPRHPPPALTIFLQSQTVWLTTHSVPSPGPWVSYCMRCDLLEENLRWSRYAALKVRPGRAPGTGHRAGQAREQPGDDKGPEAWRLGLTGRPVVIVDSLDETCLSLERR